MSADVARGPHTVRVLPGEIEFSAHDGEPIMAAANRNGWYWPTSCLGSASCARCFLTVDDDHAPALSEMTEPELDGLRRVRWRNRETPGERLGCQARVLADVTVTKRFVRPAHDGDDLPFAPSVAAVDE